MLQIGSLKLDSNLMAAPLAGFSDLAWRLMVRAFGAGIVFSEMISVNGVVHHNEKWEGIAENDPRARPFAFQIFGSEPSSFARAIEMTREVEYDLLDINMGCPVKKVVSGGAGSALMKSIPLIEKILKEVRSVYTGPLSVKIRSGWDKDSINAVDVAKAAEQCGVDCVIVHPRTRKQSFTGKADWSVIADVKKNVRVPVIGNGDVVDVTSAKKMFAETGCDGCMIGRGAVAKPWIFSEILGNPAPTLAEIFEIAKGHILKVEELKDGYHALNTARKCFPKYFAGLKGVKELARKVNSAKGLADALDALELFKLSHNVRD